MSAADDIDALTPEGEIFRAKIDRLERQLRFAKIEADEAKELRKSVMKLEKELGILNRVSQKRQPPKWLASPPKKTAGKYHGTPWLLLSDLHLDEVVVPAQVMGVNAYNRQIALLRLRETFSNTIMVIRDMWQGVVYDGIVVALAGDNFSGIIHEELKETNEDTILGSLDFWIDHLAAGLLLLADEFGKVHVPVVVGNHGRNTRKPRHKHRARDNFDWFLGRSLMRIFESDKRITFDVSEAADTIVPAYGRSVVVTHGDQTQGGGGIGGIWPPIMRMDARKSQRYAAVDMPYDLLVMGHWHQLTFGPNWIVNGAMKGYDEFAFDMNFGFEPPQQALWLMTPEHGKTLTAPIFSLDKKKEGW
jgi:hypothetical protein